MSLKVENIPPIPEATASVARAAFPKGNRYMRMRDRLGVFFTDEQFAKLFPRRGQPAMSPWRLALISIMQFVEDLSDRQAADAVRGRIDWKYALSLELSDAGFDFSVLSEFRQRLIAGGMEQHLLDAMLAELGKHDLLKKRGQQRSDATHVVAAVRDLNRLESLAETMRAALNAVAVAAPDWLQRITPPEWYPRYGPRAEASRQPSGKKAWHGLALTIGQDGLQLMQHIYASASHNWLAQLPAVEHLRQMWVHQFYVYEGEFRLREAKNLPPASLRFDSPYDPEAHYGKKRGRSWTGYKVHLTETCDDEHPHLITHVESTIAPRSDADMTASIHQALAEKDCLPSVHLADAGYVDAEQIVESRRVLDIELLGPVRPDVSWQARTQQGYAIQDFKVDWQQCTATCPEGVTARYWRPYVDAWQNDVIRIAFPDKACAACQVRSQCTRKVTGARFLTLRPQAQHETLVQQRQLQETDVWQRRYAKRAGVEGTISQAVRGFGLRHCRYIGLAKTHLQHVLTAAAINLTRLDAWFTGQLRAQTRVSRFAALAPAPG